MSFARFYDRTLTRLLRRFSNDNMSAFHRTVVNTLFIQMGMMGLTTVVSIFLSRSLGTDGRGVVSWMMAFSSFGSTCVVLGLGQASKKYISKMPTRASGFIVFDLIIMVISLIFFLPLLYHYGLKASVAQNNYNIFLCALLMIPYLAFSNLFNEILIGLGRNLHFNLLYTVEKSVNNFLNILLLIFQLVFPLAIMAIYMFAVFCRLSAGIKFIRPHIQRFPKRTELLDNFRTIRRLLFSSYFSNLAMYIASSWLTIILGLVSTTKELGYFAIAKTLTDTGLMIPAALGAFILPQLAKETNKKIRDKTIRSIFTLALGLILLIALPMILFPHLIVHLLFGDAFLPAAECLPIMAIGMISACIILVANPVIASMHKEHLLIANSSALAIGIILSTIYCLNGLNAVYAAYIYAISYTIGMIISVVNVLHTQYSKEAQPAIT